MRKYLLLVLFLFPLCTLAKIPRVEILHALKFKDTIYTKQHLKILVMLHAKQGFLKSSKKHPNQYFLTLHGVDNKIIYFADLPAQQYGVMSVQKFIRLWKRGVCADKHFLPNAVLVSRQHHHDKVTATGEVFVTVLNQHYDAKKQQLKFLIRNIGKTHPLITGSLGRVSLFLYEYCY